MENSLLEKITKEAINHLVNEFSTQGRHGFLLTHKQKDQLVEEFYKFLNQSIKIRHMGKSGGYINPITPS